MAASLKNWTEVSKLLDQQEEHQTLQYPYSYKELPFSVDSTIYIINVRLFPGFKINEFGLREKIMKRDRWSLRTTEEDAIPEMFEREVDVQKRINLLLSSYSRLNYLFHF